MTDTITLERLEAFKKACRDVILEANQSKPSALIQYAATYAREGLRLASLPENDRQFSYDSRAEHIRVQCLYILSNLTAWRGEQAKAVKTILKDLSKRK